MVFLKSERLFTLEVSFYFFLLLLQHFNFCNSIIESYSAAEIYINMVAGKKNLRAQKEKYLKLVDIN